MSKKRVLSGIQPSGKLHLGNLIGAVQNWVAMQSEYDCFYFIADLHALTTGYDDTKNLKEDTIDLAIDLLSAGIDPNKATLFLQSMLPEHSELHLLFSMVTPLPWLERIPSYKSKMEDLQGKDLNTYGFLGYPVLQAADILIYKAEYVPVGKDQLPHLELSRMISRRFNSLYGEIFPEPKDKLTNYPVLLGTDGRKMSKSYNNTIAISDAPEIIEKKVADMVTDPARVKKQDRGHPDVCSIYAYHKIFNPKAVDDISKRCQTADIGCVECKKMLAQNLTLRLAPIAKRRKELIKDKDQVKKILEQGSEKARAVAAKTLGQAKQAMGLI